jgi:hypothetical protein
LGLNAHSTSLPFGTTYARPLERFCRQRWGAKRRCIEWLFSYEEWLRVWQDSGHLHERGPRCGQYVMARKGDLGPYSADNVRIVRCEINGFESAGWKKRRTRRALEIAKWKAYYAERDAKALELRTLRTAKALERRAARDEALKRRLEMESTARWDKGSWKTGSGAVSMRPTPGVFSTRRAINPLYDAAVAPQPRFFPMRRSVWNLLTTEELTIGV